MLLLYISFVCTTEVTIQLPKEIYPVLICLKGPWVITASLHIIAEYHYILSNCTIISAASTLPCLAAYDAHFLAFT